jgi:hypothetical protein
MTSWAASRTSGTSRDRETLESVPKGSNTVEEKARERDWSGLF